MPPDIDLPLAVLQGVFQFTDGLLETLALQILAGRFNGRRDLFHGDARKQDENSEEDRQGDQQRAPPDELEAEQQDQQYGDCGHCGDEQIIHRDFLS